VTLPKEIGLREHFEGSGFEYVREMFLGRCEI
jgi:hypothetical protein